MAIPRLSVPGGSGVAWPQPLAPSDVARIRRVFVDQRRGDLPAAERGTAELDSPLLLGHILADRYLGKFHRSFADELRDWLEQYGDQPDAPAIRALLVRRLPPGTSLPPAPRTAVADDEKLPDPVLEDVEPPDHSIARNYALDRAVQSRAQAGQDQAALRLIEATKGLNPAYAAMLRAEVAHALFTRNRDDAALEIAGAAWRRAPPSDQVGLAAYVAGLAAWRLHHPVLARSYFEAAAHAPIASDTVRAAAAFWAARSDRRLHDTAGADAWLRRSAKQSHTFYGLIARRVLQPDVAASAAMIAQADVDAVAARPQGLRAFGLMQVGETERAEAELRGLLVTAKDDPALARSLLLVAANLGMVDFTAQFAATATVTDAGDAADDASHFAVPVLRPAGGYSIDPALVYALTRLESNFQSGAVSPAGARGLMQLTPVTARYIAGNPSLNLEQLHDPAVNLAIGQRYIAFLAKWADIDGDLIRMLATYNSGIGSFAHWNAEVDDHGDPLLYIEAIPVQETRNFVRRALAYTWLYAGRLGLPAPSLDDLAGGDFPRFTELPKPGKVSASARLH